MEKKENMGHDCRGEEGRAVWEFYLFIYSFIYRISSCIVLNTPCLVLFLSTWKWVP